MPSALFPKAIRLPERVFAMIKISSDLPGKIKVAFSFNAEYIARIKTVKAHRWHPEGKYWSFPNDQSQETQTITDSYDQRRSHESHWRNPG